MALSLAETLVKRFSIRPLISPSVVAAVLSELFAVPAVSCVLAELCIGGGRSSMSLHMR